MKFPPKPKKGFKTMLEASKWVQNSRNEIPNYEDLYLYLDAATQRYFFRLDDNGVRPAWKFFYAETCGCCGYWYDRENLVTGEVKEGRFAELDEEDKE